MNAPTPRLGRRRALPATACVCHRGQPGATRELRPSAPLFVACLLASACAAGCGSTPSSGSSLGGVSGEWSFTNEVGQAEISAEQACVGEADASTCGAVQYQSAGVIFGQGAGTVPSCSTTAPAAGVGFDGYIVDIQLDLASPGTTESAFVGSYPVVASQTPGAPAHDATLGVGLVGADGGVQVLGRASSGTVTVSATGSTITGTFNADVAAADGGSGTLSGSFDVPLCALH
jgi:hypothetical protein